MIVGALSAKQLAPPINREPGWGRQAGESLTA